MKLFWKIYCVVFVSFVAMAALSSYVTTAKRISDAEKSIAEEHRTIGSFITSDIERGQSESKWPFENLKKLSEHGDFIFWWVVDEDGTIHLADKASFIGSRPCDYLPQTPGALPDDNVLLDKQQNYGIFIQSFRTGQQKWTFWLGFSTEHIAQASRNIILSTVIYSASALVILGLVLYFVIVYFLRPVKNLTTGVEKMGKGDLNYRVEVESNDELGYLARSFNKMSEDLKSTTTSIDNLNREVTERVKAEEQVRQQNEFLNTVLESLTHPFYVIDANDHTIKIANSALYSGKLPEKTTCYMLTHKRDKPCNGSDDPCPLEEIKKTKRPVVTEHVHYDKDGNPRNVEVHAYPVLDDEGNVSEIIEYTLDITGRKQAEEKLRKSEEKYKTLLENLPQRIFLKDRNFVYVSCNENYARDLKIKPEEIAGKTDYEFYDKELAEKYRADDKRIMEAGTTEDIEEKYIRNGHEMIVHTVKTSIKDEEGSIVGILGIFWDITDLKRAQEAIERLSKFPSENPNPVLRVQEDGTILYSNESGLVLLDKWSCKVGEKTPERWRLLIGETFRTGKPTYEQEEVRDRIFSLTVAPVTEAEYANLYASDVTERKRAEEALEVSNRELRDFVYIASHDLREPLRKISSFGMLLEESFEGKLQGEDQENLEFMIDGANRMSQMISSLLEYSRIGGKEITYETVDLNEAIEQLEQLELAALLEETGGIIEVPQPLPKVQVDPIQIRRLLQNLIINGIRYHREGIGPRILIRAEQAAGDTVRIEVQDNGIGIEKEHHWRIFKMFKRLHSRAKYEGAGIGLAVCQKIVDRHGGRIGVESKAGAGSTFWFTLPASKKLEQEQEKLISSLET